MVERLLRMQEVLGSIPRFSKVFANNNCIPVIPFLCAQSFIVPWLKHFLSFHHYHENIYGLASVPVSSCWHKHTPCPPKLPISLVFYVCSLLYLPSLATLHLRSVLYLQPPSLTCVSTFKDFFLLSLLMLWLSNGVVCYAYSYTVYLSVNQFDMPNQFSTCKSSITFYAHSVSFSSIRLILSNRKYSMLVYSKVQPYRNEN